MTIYYYWLTKLQTYELTLTLSLSHTLTLHPSYHSSATNRLITPKDHASIQLNIGEVDSEGRYTGKSVPFAISGAVRFASEADNSLCRLATEQGILKSVWSAQL